jgi:hypothetical protein
MDFSCLKLSHPLKGLCNSINWEYFIHIYMYIHAVWNASVVLYMCFVFVWLIPHPTVILTNFGSMECNVCVYGVWCVCACVHVYGHQNMLTVVHCMGHIQSINTSEFTQRKYLSHKSFHKPQIMWLFQIPPRYICFSTFLVLRRVFIISSNELITWLFAVIV